MNGLNASTPASDTTSSIPDWVLRALLALGGLLLLAGTAVVALALAWRRGMAGLQPHQRSYAEMLRLATWLTALHAPPSATPGEIGAVLARRAPTAQATISEVVRTYVEATYSGRAPDTSAWTVWCGARGGFARDLVRLRTRALAQRLRVLH